MAKAVPRATAKYFADFYLNNVCLIHGFPKVLQSDRGSAFVSEMLAGINRLLGVDHRLSTPYRPTTQAVVERFNSTLGDMISKFCHRCPRDWDIALPWFVFLYNSAQHHSTKYTPYFLAFGREVFLPPDTVFEGPHVSAIDNNEYATQMLEHWNTARQIASENLRQASEKQKSLYDMTHVDEEFKVGDRVMLSEVLVGDAPDKMKLRYTGPHTITRKISPLSYELDTNKKPPLTNMVHVNRLKLFLRQPNSALASRDETIETDAIDFLFSSRKSTNARNVALRDSATPRGANQTSHSDNNISKEATCDSNSADARSLPDVSTPSDADTSSVEGETIANRVGRKPRTRKPTMRFVNAISFVIFFLVNCFTQALASDFIFKPEASVIWRKSKTPVIAGVQYVRAEVRYESPCVFINNSTVHPDLINETHARCEAAFEQHFVDELASFCKKRDFTEQPRIVSRPKRAILMATIIGLIVVGCVGVVTLSIASTAVAVENRGSIRNLNRVQRMQGKIVGDLEHNSNYMGTAMDHLRFGVEKLTNSYELHVVDFQLLKKTLSGTMYVIAYIMSQLFTTRQVLRAQSYVWHDGKVNKDFIDLFNITLPCEPACKWELAIAENCEFDETRQQIFIDFIARSVNQSLHILEPDPFIMRVRSQSGEICSIHWTGPQSLLYDDQRDCVYVINTKVSNENDYVLVPRRGFCERGPKPSNVTKYFQVQQCVPEHQEDEDDFIQVKFYNENNFVYCVDNKIRIGEKEFDCPDHVFAIPKDTSFRVEGFEFDAKRLYVQNRYNYSPLWNFRVNLHLQPRLEMKDIYTEINKTREALQQAKKLEVHDTQIDVIKKGMGGMTFVIVVSAVAGAVWYFYRKRSGQRQEPMVRFDTRVDSVSFLPHLAGEGTGGSTTPLMRRASHPVATPRSSKDGPSAPVMVDTAENVNGSSTDDDVGIDGIEKKPKTSADDFFGKILRKK